MKFSGRTRCRLSPSSIARLNRGTANVFERLKKTSEFGNRPVLFQPVSHQQLLASDMFVSRIEDQLMDRLLAEVLSYLRTV